MDLDLTLIAILGLLLFVFYGVPVIVPLLGFLGELVWLLALIPVTWLGRVVLRRPWTVEIVAPGGRAVAEWRVLGWLASGRAEAEIVRQLKMGTAPTAVILDEAASGGLPG